MKSDLYYPAQLLRHDGRRMFPGSAFVEFPKSETEQSLIARFERQVELYGPALAIKTPRDELSYRDLNRAANQIAHALLARGGDVEEPVALLLERGAVAAILGVLKAGKIYVPLDPSFPLARNAQILKDAAPALIITDDQHLSLVSSLSRGSTAAIVNIEELNTTTTNPGLTISPDRLAYILYTSGSTGQPKGVVQNHRNVLNVVERYTNAVGLNVNDRLALLPSISVTASVGNIFGALLNGASLFPFDVKANTGADLADHLDRYGITVYQSVPAVFRHFANALTGNGLFPDLRVIRLGSAPVYRSDFDLYKAHFSDGCVFINGYGASEMSTVSQYCMDKNTEIDSATVPIGYPLADTRIVLLDDERKPVANGSVGEIALQSRYLSPGYWRNAALSSEVFLDDPSGDGTRLYLTGDLGRAAPDGCIEHLGREDFQVKVRGFRIETAEIESALMQHAQIKEAVVIARGEEGDDKVLVAFIVCHTSIASLNVELRAHLKETLPDYMLPAAYVMLDAFPATPNGKIDRPALLAIEHRRDNACAHTSVAPRTPNEEMLVDIWCQLLGLECIGIHDNFFDLGGHSLLATQVISRVRSEFHIDLPLRALFEAPTVAGLALVVVQAQAGDWEPDEIADLLAELDKAIG
ncbi:MAG: non-ribosomal peptide synthetase [Burkholderiales bacterium]|nr:non-ribosomal peptide synthetase [Burkholderiales bacterium]